MGARWRSRTVSQRYEAAAQPSQAAGRNSTAPEGIQIRLINLYPAAVMQKIVNLVKPVRQPKCARALVDAAVHASKLIAKPTGYAIVVWDKTGDNFTAAWAGNSHVPILLIPEMAKQCLNMHIMKSQESAE